MSESKLLKPLSRNIGYITIFISLLVMTSWLLHIKTLLSLIPGGATMKFNTALLFLFSGICLLSLHYKNTVTKVIRIILLSIIIFISGLSLFEYLFQLPLNIDNLLIQDSYSTIYAGRMSPATALCFLLLSIVFFAIRINGRFTQVLLLSIASISFIAIVAYILKIPAHNKMMFINSMSIHTSLLFLGLSIATSLENASQGFMSFITGKLTGSKLMRKLLPITIGLPILLSYLLLLALNNDVLLSDFGIVLYTIIFIVFSLIYFFIIARGLNQYDAQQKKLKNLLSNSNKELSQFKIALDNVAIVAITDQKGIINYVNDKFCDISKYTKEELIGNTHAIINSGYHSKSFFKNLWQTIGKGETWVGEVKNKAKDGSYYWVHTAIVPFKNKEGKIYQYVAIRQDITKRKEAEELLNSKYVMQLEHKNKELEQFAFIASHDLQEPLRTVIGFSDLLHTDYSKTLDDDANQYLQFIIQGTKRMSLLIKGLLDYSRIGRDEKDKIKIDCQELVDHIKSDLKTVIAETKTTIDTQNLPTIYAYSTGLRLLFQNLITNAIKFRPKDGIPHIIVSGTQQENQWQFAVKDNGIGIEEKYTQKIFNIFKRLHVRSKYEGTGIGLAHCQKIVSLHGGKIWVESELGKGSTFYFTIPN